MNEQARYQSHGQRQGDQGMWHVRPWGPMSEPLKQVLMSTISGTFSLQ